MASGRITSSLDLFVPATRAAAAALSRRCFSTTRENRLRLASVLNAQSDAAPVDAAANANNNAATPAAAIVAARCDADGNFKGFAGGGAPLGADDLRLAAGAIADSRFEIKEGKSVCLVGVAKSFPLVTVVGVGEGEEEEKVDENEEIETRGETVRKAVAAGMAAIKGKPFPKSSPVRVHVSAFSPSHVRQIGEAVELSLYDFDDFKSEKRAAPEVTLAAEAAAAEEAAAKEFERGRKLGAAQNLARSLMDTPANHMTPSIFAEKVVQVFADHKDKVKVVVRDQAWAESMKMGSFISVSQGSREPLRFVEIHYEGGEGNELPLALVGKGVTFDSGGISLKPSASMHEMKADMGGAACVVAAIKGVADLNVKVNVKGFIPLCENMPSSTAVKPGDVVTAMNGKTIQVDNTDAEGRLILADALYYATSTFKPKLCVDLATLTGAMAVALGGSASGVFTNSEAHWTKLREAGVRSGDRVWRMPLWKMFTDHMKKPGVADICNLSAGSHARAGGACTAAGFLREFVDFDSTPNWMHVDIAGVMGAGGGEVPYLSKKGMAGRPVRTLVGFVESLSKG